LSRRPSSGAPGESVANPRHPGTTIHLDRIGGNGRESQPAAIVRGLSPCRNAAPVPADRPSTSLKLAAVAHHARLDRAGDPTENGDGFLPGLVAAPGWATPLVPRCRPAPSSAWIGLATNGKTFGLEPNDLPLDALARTIQIDPLDALGERPPPPLQPQGCVLHRAVRPLRAGGVSWAPAFSRSRP
jgi:hypothetical protein